MVGYAKSTAAIIVGAFILMAIAVLNGYPLVTSDTGSYINHAFDFQIPADRSPFYGVFLGLASLWSSLWWAIFVQSLSLSFVLYHFIRLATGKKVNGQHYCSFILLASVLTPVSWVNSHLMPDVFTGTLLLSVLCFWLLPAGNKMKWLWLLLIFICTLVHNSHFLLLLLFSLILFIRAVLQKSRTYIIRARIILITAGTCILFIGSLNLAKGFGFTISAGSHVFMMGKLAETGILKEYLDEHCNNNEYQLCNYKNELPAVAWEFLWSPQSALYKTGGWDSSKKEYSSIIKGVFTTPKYLGAFIIHSLKATCMQLVQIDIEAGPMDATTSPALSVQKFFPGEIHSFDQSKQNTNMLPVALLNYIYIVGFLLSSLWVLLLRRQIFNERFKQIYLLMILFILCNAFITATFANVLNRLQVRVFWVLQIANLLILMQHYFNNKRLFKPGEQTNSIK